MSMDDYFAASIAMHQLEHEQAAPRLRKVGSLDGWAATLGVTRGGFDHWIAGRRTPPLEKLVYLGRALRELTVRELERDRRDRTPLRWEDVDEGADTDE